MKAFTLLDRVLSLPSVPYVQRTKRLPDSPGLYFAISGDSEILYIGISQKSIRGRWKTYHSAASAIERQGIQDSVRIAWVLYRDVSTLKTDEKAALLEFRPTFNSMGVPGSLERQQQREAEACRVIDCDQHWHHKWPQSQPPTETKPCACIVHLSCSVNRRLDEIAAERG